MRFLLTTLFFIDSVLNYFNFILISQESIISRNKKRTQIKMTKLNDDRETPFRDGSSFYRSETSFQENSFYGQRTMISDTPFKEKHKEAVLAKLNETKSRRKEKEELEAKEKNDGQEGKNKQNSEKAKFKDTAKMVVKFIVSNLGLLIILIGYTSMGAWMFQ